MPLSHFHPVVKAWFTERFGQPSPPQAQGWPAISRGEHTLILAPTGSGKTLAAFLKCLDTLYQQGVAPDAGVQVLYISPLKALGTDIQRNLEVPLQGIAETAQNLGISLPELRTAVRTGDTTPQERAAMMRRPPHILITTPESLYLLLTSKAREMLRTVRYVIVDEIHAVCSTKRGVHLSLSLERLEALLPRSPVRIGLSATQRPLEEIARYLGGVGRPVTIIDAGGRKELDLLVQVPVADMRALPEGSMWAAIHPHLLELVKQHRSTLIFVNSRGLAERLAGRLNELAGGELVKVHHGSMSRTARSSVEADLKEGRLPCLVATSSLEMGIDVGAIDLVVQIESPKSVARGLQRVGRAGHLVGAASCGRLVPKFRGDLLEMACVVRDMRQGLVEETRVPTGALDVLAQQVIAMAAMDEWHVPDLLALLRRSYCYRDLTVTQLHALLAMLDGAYEESGQLELRPRLVWEQERQVVRGREGSRRLAVLAGGTIPDRGYYGVYLQGGETRLGEMDEEFVYESTVGDVFLLGTSTWRIAEMRPDRLVVTPALGATPRLPFWKGEGLGRPYELGCRIGAFVRDLAGRLDDPATMEWLQRECALDASASRNLVFYLQEQLEATGALPTDRQVVAEYFIDETGDWRLVVHSPFGGRVHLAWQLLLRRRITEMLGVTPEMLQTDDGLLFRLPASALPPPVADLLRLDPDEAEELLLAELQQSPLFGAYFRMSAGRALLLPRPRPGRRRPFWLQRLKAADLLQAVQGLREFPLVLETYRELLAEVLDLPGLRAVLQGLRLGSVRLHVVQTAEPSPMASSVLLGFAGAYMYADETPKAERQGALLGLNRSLLRELLGASALRQLLDERAIEHVHARLQGLELAWQPRNPDEAVDLLRRLGDLSGSELAQRGVPAEWLAALAAQGRAVLLEFSGEQRWVAASDQGLYADAVGHAGAIIRRFARQRGPFAAREVADRYGYTLESVHRQFAVLQAEGLLAAGEYTPGVVGEEFCDPEVLQQIHRATLRLLRQEIEPVDAAAYTRFLLGWHGLQVDVAGQPPGVGGRPPRVASGPPHALERSLRQLQGILLPAECWEREILPARVPGYQPLWLDQLCATGQWHWVAGAGGKVAFYPGGEFAAFSDRLLAPPPPLRDPQQAVLAALEQGGADFLGGIARSAGLSPPDTLAVLWELAWRGLVTNDTFAPLRACLQKRGKSAPPLQSGTGRWSAVSRLVVASAGSMEALATVLLQRYGLLCREIAQAEDCSWPALLDLLRRMELRGQVRRGYFVQGLAGAQFALPEAVERLRASRAAGAGSPGEVDTGSQASPGGGDAGSQATPVLVAACDPANPYGSLLPAPTRLARLPSTSLVLLAGEPVLLVEGHGKRLAPLQPLEERTLQAALGCLRGLLTQPAVLRKLRRIEVERWADEHVLESPAVPALEAAGFERTPKSMVLYR